MRAIKPNMRHRSLWRTVLLALVAIVIGGAGTVAALAVFKVIDPGKLAFWRTPERPIPADWIPIPLSARPIPAYTMVTRDYLLNPKTAQWVLVYKPPKAVPQEVIIRLSGILGRVTAREKPAGYVFTESDFLPLGTRPGVVGGTPQGKRAITLDASKLKGAHDLSEGDHVDLLASVSVDMPGAGRSGSGRMGTNVVATPDMAFLPKRSLVRPLVQDGVVVTPVRIRNVPISSSSLTQGMTTHTVPVQEIVLAVDPQEVAPLAEAMDLKYEITCVARSGRPAAVASPPAQAAAGGISQVPAALAKAAASTPGAAAPDKAASSPEKAKTVSRPKAETPAKGPAAMDITPGLDPMAQTRYLEVMIGGQRQFMLFTGPGNSPVVAGQDDGSAKAAAGEESKE
ncbi:MAG: hypothetical protein ACLQLG_20110 [Thermoguttaceae bacterium]